MCFQKLAIICLQEIHRMQSVFHRVDIPSIDGAWEPIISAHLFKFAQISEYAQCPFRKDTMNTYFSLPLTLNMPYLLTIKWIRVYLPAYNFVAATNISVKQFHVIDI